MSWPAGMRSYVDCPEPGVGSVVVVGLWGNALSAELMVY